MASTQHGWVTYTVKMPPEMEQAVAAFSQKLEVNRSETIRLLLGAGLEARGDTDWNAVRIAGFNARANAMKILVGKVREVIEELEGQ